ncbi:MAG: hypothetical protein ACTSU2_04810 [Promethearchaeota archaeon]
MSYPFYFKKKNINDLKDLVGSDFNITPLKEYNPKFRPILIAPSVKSKKNNFAIKNIYILDVGKDKFEEIYQGFMKSENNGAELGLEPNLHDNTTANSLFHKLYKMDKDYSFLIFEDKLGRRVVGKIFLNNISDLPIFLIKDIVERNNQVIKLNLSPRVATVPSKYDTADAEYEIKLKKLHLIKYKLGVSRYFEPEYKYILISISPTLFDPNNTDIELQKSEFHKEVSLISQIFIDYSIGILKVFKIIP